MRFFLLVLLFFVVQFLNAQDAFRGKVTQLTVISTTGLNLRSAPNLKSEVLASVPYGTTVELISQDSFGLDKIGHHVFHRKLKGKKEAYKNDIQGYWRKVEYNNISGYMFDAYLGRIEPLREEHKGLNQNYILLQPNDICYDNFYYDASMHWYGFYTNGSDIEMRPVEVSFFYNPVEWLYRSSMISAGNNENLVLIIGARQAIRLQKTQNKLYSKYRLDTIRTGFEEQIALFEILSKQGIYREHVLEDGVTHTKFFIEQDGVKQLLNEKFAACGSSLTASWIGDIDGDGKNDYILNFGEIGGCSVLYLSSAADVKQILKPVAVYYRRFCC